MDIGDGSVGNSHGSSLQQISEGGGPAHFEPQWLSGGDGRQRKVAQTAYLKRPPPLTITQQQQPRHGSEVPDGQSPTKSPNKNTPESRSLSPMRKPMDGENRSFPSPSVQFTPGPTSPLSRRGAPEYPQGPPSPSGRRASEWPGRQTRRGSEYPRDNRKSSVVPTGWDIHGRRDSHQSWPTNDRRLTQYMHRSGFLSQLLRARFRDDHSGSFDSNDHLLQPRVPMENTYKMEPDRQFETHAVEKIIRNVFETNLEHQQYCGPLMGQKSRTLADMIKEKVKALRYSRYKIITWVVIGQKGCNDIRIASKGLWDNDNDTYAEVFYENNSLYALGVCYGIYQE